MNNKNKNQRGSLKGKKGTVGAPPKSFTIPKGKFTMKAIFAANADSCELTIRNKVSALLKDGKLAFGKPEPQPNGAVGRPQTTFKRVYGNKAVAVVKKTRKARTVAVAATVAVTPTVAPEATPVVSAATVEVPTTAPVADVTPLIPALPVEAPASEVVTA